MTLSWGHRPPEPEPASRARRVPRIVKVAIPLIVLVAAGFVFTRPAPIVEDPARTAIAALLATQRQAMKAGDLNGYLATIDPTRVALRSCEEQRFEYLVLQKIPIPAFELRRTEIYRGYVRAWVNDLYGLHRIFVRNDGGHWLESEPTTEDLGSDVSRVFSGITVSATEAESDLIDPVGHDLDRVREAVLRYAPAPPAKLFSVRIATMASTAGRCFIAGTARPGYEGATLTMWMVTVNPDYATMSLESTNVLTHEALHWVQFDHSLDAVRAMDWWMVEGWPFRIADDPTGSARSKAVCTPSAPTYLDMRRGPQPGATAEEVERRYVMAAMLVDRLLTSYGNDAYWRLVDSFAKEPEPTRAYQQAIGVDGASFYRAWLSDMQAHYC